MGNTGAPRKAPSHSALIRAALATIRASGKRKPYPMAMRYKDQAYTVKCSNFGRVTVFSKGRLLAASNFGAL